MSKREWKFRQNPLSQGELDGLQAATGLSPLVLRVCVQRGILNKESIESYLNPGFSSLTSPFQIQDMTRAVERFFRAVDSGEKISIFGDYDVDGTTGAALLTWVMRDLGLKPSHFEARQGDRFKDGYGLNIRAVQEASGSGATLLITVDCGITSFEAIHHANELGLDCIVLDHHQIDPVKGLPEAFAVVNPQREDCKSGLKQLCGCGLAFFFAIALRSFGRERGYFRGRCEPNLKQHLDLVVIATAADMVPLVGDNRILVRHGMDVLRSSKKPGLRALLKSAGVENKDLTPGHLGFTLGPRINASGRIHTASLALELLTTEDGDRAATLAEELEKLNRSRGHLQNQIWDEVRVRIDQGIAAGKFDHGVVVADKSWHEGVVGIVASRVTELAHRPAIVIAVKDDVGKGSVRSFGGKDVLAALRRCSGYLLGFGGHRYAAGFSLKVSELEKFTQAFNFALAEIPEDQEMKPLYLEGKCDIKDFDISTLRQLEMLAPFGPGNPEPIFHFEARVKSHRVLKERHLRLNLSSLKGDIDAIWFNAAERNDIYDAGKVVWDHAEWAAVPELNRFRGSITPTVRVKDWRQHLIECRS